MLVIEVEKIYNQIVYAGNRTYFFDVKRSKNDIYYVVVTESIKRWDKETKEVKEFERHRIVLYPEDFNRICTALSDVINHVKNKLMTGFDYEKFDGRRSEYSTGENTMNSYSKKEETSFANDNSNDEDSFTANKIDEMNV